MYLDEEHIEVIELLENKKIYSDKMMSKELYRIDHTF